MNKLFTVMLSFFSVTFAMANGSNEDSESFGISIYNSFNSSDITKNGSRALGIPNVNFSSIKKLTRVEQFQLQLDKVEKEFNLKKGKMLRGPLFRLKTEANKLVDYLKLPDTPQFQRDEGYQFITRAAKLIVEATKLDLMIPRAVSLSLTQAKQLPIDAMFRKRFETLKRLLNQVQEGTCSPQMLGAVGFWTERLKLDLKNIPVLLNHEKEELQLILNKAEELTAIADCTAITIIPISGESRQEIQ